MGSEWGTPKWRQEGRTGPGPAAPKYAKAKDRRAVARGGKPGQKKSCLVAALVGLGGVTVAVGGAGYAAVEAAKAPLL